MINRPDDEPSERAAAPEAAPELDKAGSTQSGGEETVEETTIKKKSRTVSLRPKFLTTPRGSDDERKKSAVSDGPPALLGEVAEAFDNIGEKITSISADLRTDMAGVAEVLENHLEFPFLAADTHPMHGLQDWSTAVWARQIEKNPELSRLLAKALCGIEEDCPTAPSQLAALVKSALHSGQPLSKWRTVIAFQNACLNSSHTLDTETEAFYISPDLLSTSIFRREFPLGVDQRVAQYRWKFAIENSGLFEVRHRESKGVSVTVFSCVAFLFFGVIGYLLNYTVFYPDGWTMNATLQDTHNPEYTHNVAVRTKNRGVVASIATSLTFSAIVNSSLDKFGKIDPATSTVLIGMTLGGTFGYILDNMLGTDEGLREYLWRPQDGMKFALGRLASDRFGRYIVTILFDMFFTVILFKHFYSMLVNMAGFSKNGREWLANAIVSGFIGVITFQVYANMTRFSWAYPSGVDVDGSWIDGSVMNLAVVIMNMVYLQSETRVRIHEPGINDPPMKLVMTVVTFTILWQLQSQGMLEPAPAHECSLGAKCITPEWSDLNLPLSGVCEAQSKYLMGTLIFTGITVVCLGYVIFGTSQQTLIGVLIELGCKKPPPEPADALTRSASNYNRKAMAETSSVSAEDADDSRASVGGDGVGPLASPAPKTANYAKAFSGVGEMTSAKSLEMSVPPGGNRWADATNSVTKINRMSTLKRQRTHHTVQMATNDKKEHKIDRTQHMKGKVCLFFSYLLIVFLLMLFFGFTPFASHGGTRNDTLFKDACASLDYSVLDKYGLS
jgi:hypothetical protein